MGAGFVFYCVVDSEGNPRKRRGGSTYMIYASITTAKAKCRVGDAVVEMTLDLGREPLYIRARKQEADDDDA